MTEDQKAILALTKKVNELEAENKQLRKDVKLEQDLRKNYHNEETARLRDILEYIKTNTSCSVARQWANKALEEHEVKK